MDELPDPDSPFASPYRDLLGLRVMEWREGFASLACELRPMHLNRGGIVHGGLLLSLLDEAGGAAGVWCASPGRQRRSVTVDLNCRFVGQARAGRIVATGMLVKAGRTLYFSRSEVRDAAGEMLAFGSSTHRWRRDAEPRADQPA